MIFFSVWCNQPKQREGISQDSSSVIDFRACGPRLPPTSNKAGLIIKIIDYASPQAEIKHRFESTSIFIICYDGRKRLTIQNRTGLEHCSNDFKVSIASRSFLRSVWISRGNFWIFPGKHYRFKKVLRW